MRAKILPNIFLQRMLKIHGDCSNHGFDRMYSVLFLFTDFKIKYCTVILETTTELNQDLVQQLMYNLGRRRIVVCK